MVNDHIKWYLKTSIGWSCKAALVVLARKQYILTFRENDVGSQTIFCTWMNILWYISSALSMMVHICFSFLMARVNTSTTRFRSLLLCSKLGISTCHDGYWARNHTKKENICDKWSGSWKVQCLKLEYWPRRSCIQILSYLWNIQTSSVTSL